MLTKLFSRRLKYLFLTAFLLIPLFVTALWGSGERAGVEAPPDMLKIEATDSEKPSIMPPVWFSHDAHTENLQDKDCSACHRREENRFVMVFKNADELDPEGAMELYHDRCAGCHSEMKASGKKTGPMMESCRECHRKSPEQDPAPGVWQQIDFDKSLHYRHVKSKEITFKPEKFDKNCGACHHVYDRELEKTVYEKGEEGSCLYCHKEERVDDTRSFQAAAHDSCVNCHLRLREKEKEAGPVKCAGCHSREGQAEIDQIRDVPRLDWKQPDAVLMAPWLEEAGKISELPDQLTHPVAFNHVVHETAADSCRQCHHESLDKCSKCHTTKGAEEGGFVSRADAMHGRGTDLSCTGCHGSMKQKPECAGCHSMMEEKAFGELECRQCHNVDPSRLEPLPAEGAAMEKIAELEVDGRKAIARSGVSDDKIPEKVKIDIMADEYEGSEFPHRKIYRTLVEKTKGSRMAAHFHDEQETLCMGCHHNSPASMNPPRCVSCHKIEGAATEEGRPGLKGAYHGQCIGCHDRMGIKEPAAADCTACHKPRTGKSGVMEADMPGAEG